MGLAEVAEVGNRSSAEVVVEACHILLVGLEVAYHKPLAGLVRHG